jgi:hypothetical protein
MKRAGTFWGKFFLFFQCMLVALSSTAQDCTKEQLRIKPGRWKAGQQGQIVNVKAADLIKEKAVITSIHKMVAANYQPSGCEVLYSTVYGKGLPAASNWIADPFHYTMYILRYLCDRQSPDKSKYYVDISTPTTVTITANAMYWLNSLYAANMNADDFRGYLKLPAMPVQKDGYYFMSEEEAGDDQLKNEIKEYRWLITYNDTLPFAYVSRKEYLLIQKKRLEKTLKDHPEDGGYYAQYFDRINNFLTQPEDELGEPAICSWNDEERFEGFVAEGTKGSFIAVKPNLAYYRKKLPMSSPQFFTVVYKIAQGDPVFEENIANIKKAVDFATLRNMLGK